MPDAIFCAPQPTTAVSAHSAGYEGVPRVWPFNATEKLGPDISELLSMHCSWCVLYCGEAHFRGEPVTHRGGRESELGAGPIVRHLDSRFKFSVVHRRGECCSVHFAWPNT